MPQVSTSKLSQTNTLLTLLKIHIAILATNKKKFSNGLQPGIYDSTSVAATSIITSEIKMTFTSPDPHHIDADSDPDVCHLSTLMRKVS
jgi:hypothetical protein